jgi:hypothetical protein
MPAAMTKANAKMWFGYLKLALKAGIPINDQFYADWGLKEDLAAWTFNKWWVQRGKALFEQAAPTVKVLSASESTVVLEIPTSMGSVQVKAEVSRLMTEMRGTRRLKVKPPIAFTGAVNYDALKQYERLLEIDMDPRYAGETLDQKTVRLRRRYEAIASSSMARKETFMSRGNKRASNKVTFRKPSDFGDAGRDGSTSSDVKRGVDPKKAGRWLVSGRILALNAASGVFPGGGYYGASIGTELKRRLKALGLAEFGSVERARGGGRTTEERQLVKRTKTKKQREADSLKAYGATKGRKVGAA